MKILKFAPVVTIVAIYGVCASAQEVPPNKAPAESAPADKDIQKIEKITVTGGAIGKGEARANSVVDKETILQQPAGLDALKMLTRVPGLQVGSGDALTGSFSLRLSMRGLNKEQIGISVDGIPNGSSLSNGGTLPNRLLDSSNLTRIDVSQTAGEIGTPSNQALGGFIDFKTRDPSRERGGDVELGIGNYKYQREFVRYDTGEFADGMRAYIDFSHSYARTWPGEQSGRSTRDHADFRIMKDFSGGSTVRATVSYNKLSDNDYDAVALRALSAPFYRTNFETNPNTDGLTDRWTGNPAIDQNNRSTRGIDSTEVFAHIDGIFKFGDLATFTVKPYLHRQYGNGWFYVPYKQLPSNGIIYSAVPQGVAGPVSTAQECFANQYQRTSTGALIPVSAVTFPTGVTAASLRNLGCPAAARFAMNPQAQWGAREASRRRGGYETTRQGALADLAVNVGDFHRLRVGGWLEHIDRNKTRNWYLASDPKVNFDYDESSLYSITQDRQYISNTSMGYIQDRISFFEDKAELDIGVTYQRFRETYQSPVEFFGSRALSVSSGLLPKISGLLRLSDELEIFASGSKNFSAIPDSVFEGSAAIDAKSGIKPETSINKDIGVRWERGKFGLALSAFSIDYRDRISIQNGNPNGDIFSRDATTSFRNLGGIRSNGLEAVGRYSASDFEVYANYAYNNAHFVEDTLAEGIRKGDPVLGIAKSTAFFEATWKPHSVWRFTANAKYVGKAAGTYGDVSGAVIVGGPSTYPREYMPQYVLYGASASYRPGGVWLGVFAKPEISIIVDNLTDRRYLAGLGLELSTSNPLTTGRYFIGSPRAIFATFRSQF